MPYRWAISDVRKCPRTNAGKAGNESLPENVWRTFSGRVNHTREKQKTRHRTGRKTTTRQRHVKRKQWARNRPERSEWQTLIIYHADSLSTRVCMDGTWSLGASVGAGCSLAPESGKAAKRVAPTKATTQKRLDTDMPRHTEKHDINAKGNNST
jgi:hypothetical protein